MITFRQIRPWAIHTLSVTALTGITGWLGGPPLMTAFQGLGMASVYAQAITGLVCFGVGLSSYLILKSLFDLARDKLAKRKAGKDEAKIQLLPKGLEKGTSPKPKPKETAQNVKLLRLKAQISRLREEAGLGEEMPDFTASLVRAKPDAKETHAELIVNLLHTYKRDKQTGMAPLDAERKAQAALKSHC